METQEQVESQPRLEDTQPIKPVSPVNNRRWRWFLFAFSSIVFAGLIILSALPSLLFPPSELASPYELFSLSQVSEELDSGRDHLVIALDGDVELYLPQGVDLGAGNLVILPRPDEFVPERVGRDRFLKFAVDIFLVRPDGNLVNSISFDPAILLCFRLDPQDLDDRSMGVAHFEVQRYDEERVISDWVTLDPVPGWREDQACSALNHLSLYTLAVTSTISSTEPPAAKDIESTPAITPALEPELDELQLYGFPPGTVTP